MENLHFANVEHGVQYLLELLQLDIVKRDFYGTLKAQVDSHKKIYTTLSDYLIVQYQRYFWMFLHLR